MRGYFRHVRPARFMRAFDAITRGGKSVRQATNIGWATSLGERSFQATSLKFSESTDKTKQHFDDIYVASNPVPYKREILDALSYVSDNFNREMFDAHILPWALKKQQSSPVKFLDLCACFGNSTLATVYGMSYDEIRENWKDEESCYKIQGQRRFDSHIIAADISGPAMDFGKDVGLYDQTFVCNMNDRSTSDYAEVLQVAGEADIFLSTAALVYLDLETVEDLIKSFAQTDGEGYVLVNFLNPFGLEKADATKSILLKHLDFVGSRATRHRRMSELEQSNYPGEEWALLELWVLKRRSGV